MKHKMKGGQKKQKKQNLIVVVDQQSTSQCIQLHLSDFDQVFL